ncbi:MAG: putative lipid II flippase FtsW [Succinivibrionaceae bacterium]
MLDLWRKTTPHRDEAPYDRQLFFLVITLILIGFVMIFSASVAQASNKYDNMFFFAYRDLVAIGMALATGAVCLCISRDVWFKYSLYLFIAALAMLLAVLVLGSEINKARRWISLGFMNIQPAEIMKFCWIVYLSGFLSRKRYEVLNKNRAFVKQAVLLVLLGLLLLLQPDFGSLAVIVGLFLGMLLLAGARKAGFVVCTVLILLLMAGVAILEPYRVVRLTSFLNPWEDPFGKGYQLTQSLMAFGRGGFWGVGLGNSIQKMEYLPEAHTDFVFAILGEELGYAGVATVMLLELWLVWRTFAIGVRMIKANEYFSGLFCCGVGLQIAMQTFINVGAASGMLPTKGLTLPLISYGGSSLAVMTGALAVVLRLDYEFRQSHRFVH